MARNKQDIGTVNTVEDIITFDKGADIVEADLAQPNVVQLGALTLTKAAVKQSVTSATFSEAISVGVPNKYDASFTEVDVNAEVNNDTFNLAVSTLKDSINTKRHSFLTDLATLIDTNFLNSNSTYMDVFLNDADGSLHIDALTKTMNLALEAYKTNRDTEVNAINTDVATITGGLNLAFQEVTTGNVNQNTKVATAINNKFGILYALTDACRQINNISQEEIAAVDTYFVSETETAGEATSQLDILSTYMASLKTTNANIIAVTHYLLNEVARTPRRLRKVQQVTSETGEFNINFEGIGWEIKDNNDNVVPLKLTYVPLVPNVKLEKVGQTLNDASFRVLSDNIHIQPQPVNCKTHQIAGQPAKGYVDVLITATYEKLNVPTYLINRLVDAYEKATPAQVVNEQVS